MTPIPKHDSKKERKCNNSVHRRICLLVSSNPENDITTEVSDQLLVYTLDHVASIVNGIHMKNGDQYIQPVDKHHHIQPRQH